MDDGDRLRQALWSARGLMFIQGLLATATAVVEVVEAVGHARDGSAETSVSWFSVGGSVVVAAGLVVSAVLLFRRAWARVLALVIEAVGVVFAVVTLVGGDVLSGLSRLALAALVILGIVQYELGSGRGTASPPGEPRPGRG
ncbi:hypothetical protein UO65_1701 [Actinokineospora spheciospongiae]|uniref:Uncharacterized protein n=1 Tax=Actinokineospora spheciospongiae TaxID=909613 RepID=W7J1Z4_9PSEU|nr:hypothetical protein [Actinokineospora spheciospongiae]EWC62991.1 hypothetical protein UO65_1701 [Actinokineospora spheciospongiae]